MDRDKLENGTFHPNFRKYFFTVRMTERCHSLLGAVMKPLSLEIHSKAILDVILSNWL